MKFTPHKKSGLILLSIVLFLPCLANATVLGTVDVLYSGIGAREFVNVWGGTAEGAYMYAGASLFQKVNGTGQGDLWNNLGIVGGFSIDLAEQLAGNPIKTYDVIMPQDGPRYASYPGSSMGLTKQKYLQELWGRYYDSSWTNIYNTSKQNAMAAAFSLAIWEIVYEDFTGTANWDVTVDGTPGDGGFATDYEYYSIANNWLHSLDGTGPRADLRVFSMEGGQDFLVAVPEPMTIILLSTGSLIMLKRKRVA